MYFVVHLHRAFDLLVGDVDARDRRAYESISQIMSTTKGHLQFESSMRVRAWDAKLLAKEEDIADGRGDLKQACPCNVFIAGVCDVLFRKTVRKHLNLFGRHLFHRGSTEVSL